MVASVQVNPANTYRFIERSQFANVCASCRIDIQKGTPILYRPSDKKVHHSACPILPYPIQVLEQASKLSPENASQSSPKTPERVSRSIPDGTYTVASTDYPTGITFRIRRNREDASFAPNARVIATLTGPDNESSYTAWAFVNDAGDSLNVFPNRKAQAASWKPVALALLTGDWKQAGITYAKQSGSCYRCGRKLTVVSSIDEGLGPICAGKVHGT